MKLDNLFCPSGVLLDMDGLMLDTESTTIPLWQETGRIMGLNITEESALRTLGRTGPDIRKSMIDDYGEDFPYDAFREKLHLLINEEYEKGINLRPGLLVLLDRLAAIKIPYAVATSTFRKIALFKLRKAGILDRFDIIVCGDDVKNGKPAPDIFLEAARRIGIPPDKCIGFEDSVAGLKGLHSAGIKSVFVKDLVIPGPDVLACVWRQYTDLAEAAKDIFPDR